MAADLTTWHPVLPWHRSWTLDTTTRRLIQNCVNTLNTLKATMRLHRRHHRRTLVVFWQQQQQWLQQHMWQQQERTACADLYDNCCYMLHQWSHCSVDRHVIRLNIEVRESCVAARRSAVVLSPVFRQSTTYSSEQSCLLYKSDSWPACYRDYIGLCAPIQVAHSVDELHKQSEWKPPATLTC